MLDTFQNEYAYGLIGISYLVCYYRTAGSSGICCNLEWRFESAPGSQLVGISSHRLGPYHNTLIVDTSNNCCTGTCGLGKGNTPSVKRRIAVVVCEVEAGHRDNAGVRDQLN